MTIEAEMKKVAVDLRVKPDDYNDFSILFLYTVLSKNRMDDKLHLMTNDKIFISIAKIWTFLIVGIYKTIVFIFIQIHITIITFIIFVIYIIGTIFAVHIIYLRFKFIHYSVSAYLLHTNIGKYKGKSMFFQED